MRALILLAALLAPLPALAHTGVGTVAGFAAGALHPLSGLDHLAAMVAVGLWAALSGGAARWLLPLGFLGGMAAGGALGLLGVALPMAEGGILASLLVLGALVGAAARLPAAVAVPVVALFGLAHGHAHGTEMTAGADALAYAAGFLAVTALLHAAGLLAGIRLAGARARIALRLGGGATTSLTALVALLR
jgi:urease accessory protein